MVVFLHVLDVRVQARAQQAAFQPCGKGISGQASWLSLAAFGGALKDGRPVNMTSSPGTGAIAACTVLSNVSNSTSLTATSQAGEASSQKCFVAGLPGSLKL